MSATAFSGPVVTFREDALASLATPPVGIPANQNPDAGPSLFHMGTALLDPRPQYTYFAGDLANPMGFNSAGVAINTAPVLGWLNATFQVSDYAPGTASTFSIGSGASITASTTIALTASSTANITVGATATNATTGAVVTGLWLIDTAPNNITYGTNTFGIWDPANPPIGRCLSLTSGAGDLSGVTFTVSGYDAYGYPITQAVTGPTTSSTVYTGKAFKWVSGVSSSATASTAISVGVSDRYGLAFYASSIGYIYAFWNDKLVAGSTTATTFTAGVTATATTSSDVRGTINLGGMYAADGVKKLQMWQWVSPANLSTTGLFGVTPR